MNSRSRISATSWAPTPTKGFVVMVQDGQVNVDYRQGRIASASDCQAQTITPTRADDLDRLGRPGRRNGMGLPPPLAAVARLTLVAVASVASMNTSLRKPIAAPP